MPEETGFFHGSAYHNRLERKAGWGKFFGFWFMRQGQAWEVSYALFGRTFWFGCHR